MLRVISEFPYEATKTLLEILRTGTLDTRKHEASEALWNIVGYCTFMLLDPRAPKQQTLVDSEPKSETEIVGLLDGFVKTHPIDNPKSNKEVDKKLNAPFNLKELLHWALDLMKRLH